MKDNKVMNFFQRLGKSFMLPISLMAAMGILMGLGSAAANEQVIEILPFLGEDLVMFFTQLIRKVAGVGFAQLPLLFAVTLAMGMAKKDKEFGAFAGVVGFITLQIAMQYTVESTSLANAYNENALGAVLGYTVPKLDALGGILVAVTVAGLHNRFAGIKLPNIIAFFGGKRFVPIITVVVFTVFGLVIPFIWLPISNVVLQAGEIIAKTGHFGAGIFGALERLLIPFGLHHILNALVRTTELGGVATYANGETISGALNVFNEYLATGVEPTQGLSEFTRFLGQGKMPIMMFGLPAAGLAIYHTAKTKKYVKPLIVAGIGASLVTGITEPLEFAFLFVSPILYLFHAIMTGLSFFLQSLLGTMIGNTQGGLIDFVVFGILQPNSGWINILIVGIPMGLAYYFVFKYVIIKKDVKTPGREDDVVEGEGEEVVLEGTSAETAAKIVEGLGGSKNIVSVENCFTRLRVEVKDMGIVNDAILKSTGAAGIVKPNDTNVQVIYGPQVEHIASDVKTVIA